MEALAVIRSYDDLRETLRNRADALKMSRETIDHIAGFASGFASKALMRPPTAGERARMRRAGKRTTARGLGPQTLGPMLETLGLQLVVVENPDAMKRLERGYPERCAAQVRASI